MAPSQRLQFDAAHIAMALSLSLSDVASRFRESRAATHRFRNMATLRAFLVSACNLHVWLSSHSGTAPAALAKGEQGESAELQYGHDYDSRN
jgi:hypothetical protein